MNRITLTDAILRIPIEGSRRPEGRQTMGKTLSAWILASGLALGGCAGAYGGRTVTRGELTLVYDPGVHVYVVESHPDLYYSGGFYFRFSSGTWLRSRAYDGPWEHCSERRVPPGLRRNHGHHDRGRHRGRDRDEDRD
jgi:hypothetical protein